MPSNIRYLKYVFLGLFTVCCIAIVSFDLLYGMPRKKCLEAQGWWSWKYRTCATPVYLPTLTGRKEGQPATIDWHTDKK